MLLFSRIQDPASADESWGALMNRDLCFIDLRPPRRKTIMLFPTRTGLPDSSRQPSECWLVPGLASLYSGTAGREVTLSLMAVKERPTTGAGNLNDDH